MNAAVEMPEETHGGNSRQHAGRTQCRSCGIAIRSPRKLCSRCQLAEATTSARKLAETDAQVQALRRHIGKACVSIASSLDTLPPASILPEMRARWLLALRQATRAIGLVEERLAADSK